VLVGTFDDEAFDHAAFASKSWSDSEADSPRNRSARST
jgi:hypothetical protein